MKVSFQIFWPWVSVFNGTTRMFIRMYLLCRSIGKWLWAVGWQHRRMVHTTYLVYIRRLDGCYGVASAFLRMMMLGFRRFHPLMAMAYIPDEKVNFLPYYYLGVRRSSHTEAFQCMQQCGGTAPGTGMLCSTCVHKPLIGACLAASTITCVCGF